MHVSPKNAKRSVTGIDERLVMHSCCCITNDKPSNKSDDYRQMLFRKYEKFTE